MNHEFLTTAQDIAQAFLESHEKGKAKKNAWIDSLDKKEYGTLLAMKQAILKLANGETLIADDTQASFSLTPPSTKPYVKPRSKVLADSDSKRNSKKLNGLIRFESTEQQQRIKAFKEANNMTYAEMLEAYVIFKTT